MRQPASAGARGLAARRRTRSRPSDAYTPVVRGLLICLAFASLVSIGFLIREPSVVRAVKEHTGVDLAKAWRKEPARNGPIGDRRPGTIVQEHPNGIDCQYTQFDNITGTMSEPTTHVCEDLYPKRTGNSHFKWGQN